MGETPNQVRGPAAAVRRATTWVRGRPLRQLASWFAGLGLVLTAPFGGWADAQKPALAVAKPDQVIKTGPLDVTINRISASTRPGRDFTEAKDGHYLMVFGTVRSTAMTTLKDGELRDAVRLAGLDGLERYGFGTAPATPEESHKAPPMTYFVEDSTSMTQVSPLMTYEIAWVWRRHATGIPSSVDVTVNGFTFRKSNLQDTEGWMDATPLTHLRLPVAVKPAWVDPNAKPTTSPSPTPSASASS